MAARLDIVGIAALTLCCWLTLAVWPTGQLFVCGAGGIAQIIPAWSGDRAISLLAMWTVMSAGMMLPCVMVEIARGGAADRAVDATLVRAIGLAAVVPPAQWTLESLGAMSGGVLLGGASTQILLTLIAATAAGVHLASGVRWAVVVAMLALQFAGNPMSLGWMAVVSAGMLLLALLGPTATRHNDALIKSSMLIQTE